MNSVPTSPLDFADHDGGGLQKRGIVALPASRCSQTSRFEETCLNRHSFVLTAPSTYLMKMTGCGCENAFSVIQWARVSTVLAFLEGPVLRSFSPKRLRTGPEPVLKFTIKFKG